MFNKLLGKTIFKSQKTQEQKFEPQDDCGEAIEPYPDLVRMITLFSGTDNSPDILYLGDSVVERIADEDVDKRNLGELVTHLCSGYNIGCITHTAYNPEVYYYMLRALDHVKSKPKCVILPVNMRCFSPQWDLNPYWQFNEELKMLKEYIKDPGIEIRSISPLRKDDALKAKFKEFDDTRVEYPETPLKFLGEFRKICDERPVDVEAISYRYKQIFIYHYMYPLDSLHKKLKILNEIQLYLAGKDILLFAYIPPINYEAARHYVGDRFMEVYEHNVKVMCESMALRAMDRTVLKNYSYMLEREHFFHQDCTVEHINERGREMVARAIVNDLNEYMARG